MCSDSSYEIVFSPRAVVRLDRLVNYLFKQTYSIEFALNFIDDLEKQLTDILCLFPESGTLMPKYGKHVRRMVCKKYSFLYRIKNKQIEIITVYKQNLP